MCQQMLHYIIIQSKTDFRQLFGSMNKRLVNWNILENSKSAPPCNSYDFFSVRNIYKRPFVLLKHSEVLFHRADGVTLIQSEFGE